MEITPDQIRLAGIFLPYAVERQNIVQSSGTRFVHYTRADAAMSILKTKTVWMRKTSCMNDFMEVEHGLACLAGAYRGEAGNRLKGALNDIFGGVSDEIEKLFNGWEPHFRTDTYIMCLSEHLDAEDSFGRLSMWRAFSGTTGIALVLNNTPFFSSSNAFTPPLTSQEIVEKLNRLAVFRVESFDARAAIEVAAMTRGALGRTGKKRGEATGVWQKIKYDRQIVAIAKVAKATTIYSDDGDIRAIATAEDVPVVGLAELPLPDTTRQGDLFKHQEVKDQTVPEEEPEDEA